MVILGISLLFGVLATSIIHIYDQKNANKNDIETQEEEQLDPEEISLLQHESQLLTQLISHHKQLLHIEDQCDRLRSKDSSSELITRYEEDAAMLEIRAQEISEDVHQLWKNRMLLTFERDYNALLKGFPSLPLLDKPQQQRVYKDIIAKIQAYMTVIKNKISIIDGRTLNIPAKMYAHEQVLEFVQSAREHTLQQCQVLLKKSDSLCDQLQYLCDSLQNVQISGDVQWDQSGLNVQIQDLSSYLSRPEALFHTPDVQDPMQEYSDDIQSTSTDIRSRFRAHREVEQNLRSRYKKH